MLVDRFGVRCAWRTPNGVVLHDRRAGLPPPPLASPAGHHVVAVAFDPPYGRISSDGARLWVWQRPRFLRDATDPAPVDLATAAREALSPERADAAMAILAAAAAQPQGPLRCAAFFLTAPTRTIDGRNPEPGPPRWPTVTFGCGDRVIAAQLDFFCDRGPSMRRLLVSPDPELRGPNSERVILAFPTTAYVAVGIVECYDGTIVVGHVRAPSDAFDDAYACQTKVDIASPTHGAAMVPVQVRHLFALASEQEVLTGTLRANAGTVEVLMRVPRREGERLIGVTARGEALVISGRRVLARSGAGDSVVHTAERTIEEATAGLGYGLYRLRHHEGPRPLDFRF